MADCAQGRRWRWVHRRADGTFRPESYVLLGTIRTADGMVNRVAYYSRMAENPMWTQFHGGWEDRGAIMRVCFSHRGTDEFATWNTLNRMLDDGGRLYYQGFKQERDEMRTLFMVEPCDVPLDVPNVTSPSNKMPRTEGRSGRARRSWTRGLGRRREPKTMAEEES